MSGTTWVSRYQKGKTRKVKANLDLLEQDIVSGSGISWAICKSAPQCRQPHQHPTTTQHPTTLSTAHTASQCSAVTRNQSSRMTCSPTPATAAATYGHSSHWQSCSGVYQWEGGWETPLEGWETSLVAPFSQCRRLRLLQ